jgi:Na+/H+ antiporter NhaD/arsenite permease-like protein
MIEFSQGPVLWQTIAAVLIFAVAFVLILAEVWNRTYTALAGAAMMIVLGIIPVQWALTKSINWNVLLLIAGFYIISNFFGKTGVVPYLAVRLIRFTSAKPVWMLLALALISALGSALFDGLIMILSLVPFTLHAARILKISAVPFVIAEILMAHLGGTATLIGGIHNRLIGAYAELSFTQFLSALGPLVLLLMVVCFTLLFFWYRKDFLIAEDRKKELLKTEASAFLMDRQLLLRGGAVIGAMVLAFFLQNVLGVRAGIISISGALLLLVVDYKAVIAFVKQRDYTQLRQGIIDSQLLFFVGLFIMVGGLTYAGVSGYAAARWVEIAHGSVPFTAMMLLWFTGLGSAVIDAIPYTAAMLPIVNETESVLGLTDAGTGNSLWWALAIGTGLGGAGTLAGSSINMVAAGMALEQGERFTHWQYVKIAGLLTLIMMLLASVYMYVFLL